MKAKLIGDLRQFYVYLGIDGGEQGIRFFCQIVEIGHNREMLHEFEVKIKGIDDYQGIIEGLTKLFIDFKFDERFVVVPGSTWGGQKSNIEWEDGRRRNSDGSINTAVLRAGELIAAFLLSFFPKDIEYGKSEYEAVLPYDLRSTEQRTEADLSDPLRNHFQLRKKKEDVKDDDLLF